MGKRNGYILCLFFVSVLLLLQGCRINAHTEDTNRSPSGFSNHQTECTNPDSSTSMKWLHYEGNCYCFNNESFFSYDEGKEFCKSNGAVLSSIHSSQEMHFIREQVPSYVSSYWIGMRRNFSSRPPRWEDDTPTDYSNFHNDGDYYGGKRCALFYTSSGYWSWQPCDVEAHVLCKFKKDTGHALTRKRTVRDTPGFCPDDWYTFDDMCYRIYKERKSWDGAVGSCRAIDSNLVSIHDAEEQDFLNLLVVETRYDTWIGMRRSSQSHSEFYWNDNSPLDFTNWAEGEPNDYENLEDCVTIHYAASKYGEWNDVMCRLSKSYICKKPKDRTLKEPGRYPDLCYEPKDWTKMWNSCYKVFYETKGHAPWSRAQSLCQSYDGNLVNINDNTVTLFLRFQLKGLKGPFWTGIKSTRKHKYTWLGKHLLVYSNWGKDEPKELADEQNCVATDSDGKWMVRDCDESHPFICEVNKHASEAPTIEPYHPNMTCPYGSPKWHDLGGKYCYIIELGAQVKWYEASCRCGQEGGFLASFHSFQEINVIRHYVAHHDSPLHIGFARDKQGLFVWSDGSVVDFVNWNYGEPNSRDEECAELHIKNGKWNDIACASPHGYVCSAIKVPVIENETRPQTGELKDDEKQLGAGGIAVIITCFVVVVAVSAVIIYFLAPSLRKKFTDKTSYSGIK